MFILHSSIKSYHEFFLFSLPTTSLSPVPPYPPSSTSSQKRAGLPGTSTKFSRGTKLKLHKQQQRKNRHIPSPDISRQGWTWQHGRNKRCSEAVKRVRGCLWSHCLESYQNTKLLKHNKFRGPRSDPCRLLILASPHESLSVGPVHGFHWFCSPIILFSTSKRKDIL